MASDLELSAMRQAITLSALGLGTTSPNPPVGCVILDRHGTVVGAGFHRRKGEPHAEVHALNAAGGAARGGTAVVTLEPCNHVGVTPACRQELIDAGISRVFIAVMDPTSRGEGGASMLAAAGVEVETDVLRDEALTVLEPWLTATVRRRPYVTWAFAADGGHQPAAEERLLLDLCANADLAIAGKTLYEGIPGGHASAHFALPDDADIGVDPSQWLSAAYEGGVRSVLVVGHEHGAAMRPHLHAVDELVVAVPRTDPSRALAVVQSDLIPIGFRLVEFAAHADSLTARMRRLRA
ncbi:bifunctional diaminohydroxyphosphoribosylaminopyrimidine deaminase/5-amino-6-(5-phosphoribosylamino)uracil reductase RibD [Micromonospora sp. DH14]|uniref:bifunctional diaminohydroxyphosphoribosylaminopyrimidine deaminase/5-amino-6-(5-phosphoribosylamino)uracil reductase RibD n=1 Tax=Micromonospora sp. DH14 TaxID=3040120 RepID=UPI002440FEBD|nr:bifunctional diaminohydroxyphosphoribosylaminopyrimidine deaminase/5-amino-6-(5-phosphoribosylamino)uracil reductase RibD [Micromonospora sp. DH14]MDG9674676.1 bifunctional diaminohydroxyphosphoribosylaminopyrimidine deaminase/5-amino-6-(5-phosphoribosylamino)uracil reductase RibD [Micromonospora sp. DH14]